MSTKQATSRVTAIPEYRVWAAMIERCEDTNKEGYERYGGRGIGVCDSWRHSFQQFYVDMGSRPGKGYSLDRIDNDGDYEPTNCRWATPSQQQSNRCNNRLLTHEGLTLTMEEWSRRKRLCPKTIAGRLDSGWSVADALDRPPTPISRKLSESQVRELLLLRGSISCRGAARRFGINQGTVRRIWARTIWSWVVLDADAAGERARRELEGAE